VPWNRRPPSEYVREHVRFTLQPNDSPPDPAGLRRMIEQVGSDDLFLFSTDYPHRHFDDPDAALPSGLPDASLRKILAENAREWYGLGAGC
ncbi:MAG TPA: amidohydrolase family protein, partial [Chloroflexota bacterium]|nr:amidohydrolase family protein [Chloroflexota bacterium]